MLVSPPIFSGMNVDIYIYIRGTRGIGGKVNILGYEIRHTYEGQGVGVTTNILGYECRDTYERHSG